MKPKKIIFFQALAWNKVIIFSVLITIVSLVPAFFHIQWLTGALVNFILFLIVIFVGLSEAVIAGLIPSTIAFMTGLLPLPLAIMIPFIMLGNAIMVKIFSSIYKKQFFLSIFCAAFLKFFFLWITARFVVAYFIREEFVQKLFVMMGGTQFATACIGGFMAYFVFRFVKRGS